MAVGRGALMAEKQVDVLVIGSGMDGMCADAYLAHKEYRVLVAEALPRLGGHRSTIGYKGIKCTTGVMGPGLVGPPSSTSTLWGRDSSRSQA